MRLVARKSSSSQSLAYGDSANDAMAKAQILALRVLAERLEHNETGPQAITFTLAA